MRTGKCREYQITSIRLTVIYLHSGQTLIHFADMWHIGKIELRINSIGIHVHCDCDDIHVTGTLSVSKQCSLNPVCSRKQSKLCIADTASSVVVWMKA